MSDTKGLTRQIAGFVTGLRYEDIPPEAFNFIRTGFTDCIATMVAARNDEPAQVLRKVIDPAPGPSNLLFGMGTARPSDAALINGTSGHTLDFDDTTMKGHPSVTLVHSILAEAQNIGANGKQMARAYAAGMETWGELARRDPDGHELSYGSFHPTGMYGSVASAAAVSALLGLSEEQTVHALAIGASHASGIYANFGSCGKPYHAGRAAQAGVLSARLAQGGFTGSVDALENKKGFLMGLSPKKRVDVSSPVQLGKEWSMLREGQGIKKYPACYASHRAVDAMLDLVSNNDINPAKVESIDVTISDRDRITLAYEIPNTELQAKFSAAFPVVAALVAHRCSLVEFTDEMVQRPDIQSLMKKVKVHVATEELPGSPGTAKYQRVVITTSDGKKFDNQVDHVRGGPVVPLAPGELFSKFESCLQFGKLNAPAKPIFDALMRIETLSGPQDIYRLAS